MQAAAFRLLPVPDGGAGTTETHWKHAASSSAEPIVVDNKAVLQDSSFLSISKYKKCLLSCYLFVSRREMYAYSIRGLACFGIHEVMKSLNIFL